MWSNNNAQVNQQPGTSKRSWWEPVIIWTIPRHWFIEWERLKVQKRQRESRCCRQDLALCIIRVVPRRHSCASRTPSTHEKALPPSLGLVFLLGPRAQQQQQQHQPQAGQSSGTCRSSRPAEPSPVQPRPSKPRPAQTRPDQTAVLRRYSYIRNPSAQIRPPPWQGG
jgi:hypothetical protein